MKKKLLVLVGTRPEAIKLGPVIRALREVPSFKVTVCLTGQHRHIAEPMLEHFGVSADEYFKFPRSIGSLTTLVGAVADRLGKLIVADRPDLIVVQGDTTTAMLGAICGFYERIPVAHVEAGLRSWDFEHPFPEEFNRRVISLAGNIHFAPTEVSADNLRKEGVSDRNIHVVGNTCIDALLWTLKNSPEKRCFPEGTRGILVTGHRRENWEKGLASMAAALHRILSRVDDVSVLFPVHPNPKVKEIIHSALGDTDRVRLTEPLDYVTFCRAMQQAALIITDSGGVQEEALALGTPTLVTRKVTERPEVLDGGTVKLVGNKTSTLVAEACSLLSDPAKYRDTHVARFPFGKGDSSTRIARVLARKLK